MSDALSATNAAYGQIGGAWGQLFAALDVPQEKHSLDIPVDIPAVALDMMLYKLRSSP